MRTGRSVVLRLWLRTHLLFAKKAKSPRKAKTKNAIGKGISIGCRGWRAIDAVLFGLFAIGVGMK